MTFGIGDNAVINPQGGVTVDALGVVRVGRTALNPLVTSFDTLKNTRRARIAAFNAGPITLAAARANTTAYAVNDVLTYTAGRQVIVTGAGTTAGAEPAGLLDGRPFTDGTVTAYYAGFSKSASDADFPAISQVAAGALAAAGLTELRFASGTAPAIIATSADGVLFNDNTAYLGITQAAVGTLAAGAGNSPVTNAHGLPVAIGGESLSSSMCSAEFIVEDTKFGLTTHNFGFSAIVLIDGRPVIGNGAIAVAAGGGNAIVFDFNGLSKPRRVSVYSNNGAFSTMRGVALTAQGKCYAVPRNGDVMAVFGDSYNTTVQPNTIVNPNMSYWLKNYLGLDGLPVMAVGGTGYIVAAVANTYNLPAVISSASNRLLFPYYNPTHILVNAGGNDGGQTAANIKAAALATWQQLRRLFPTAKITITDGNSGASGPSANSLAVAVALADQFAVWADENSRFIPIISPLAANSWVTGTSHAGQALAAGNSALWTSTDGTHPSPGGAQFLGRRLAAAIDTAWQGCY